MRTHRMTPARQARMRAELQAKLAAAPSTTRGRNRPVERDEVVLGKDRTKTRYVILTLPADACTTNEYGDPVPIEALVEPLVEELRREYKEFYDRETDGAALYNDLEAKHRDPESRYILMEMRARAAKEVIEPSMPIFFDGSYRDCRHCGKTFAHVAEASRLRYCSEECAEAGKADRTREWVERRTAARGNARAQRCLWCGEGMEASRASKRYCSGRCRVAAHREGK